MRALALTLLLFLAGPALAFGHAGLTGSEPAPGQQASAPPEQLRLVFDEPLAEAGLAVSVLAPDGAELVERFARRGDDPSVVDVELRGGGPQGVHIVRWRTLSVQGHVAYGRYRFGVGVPAPAGVDRDPAFDALAALARALAIAGPALLLGLVVLRLGIAPAAHATRRVARAGRLWWRAWLVGLVLWAIGLALIVVRTDAAMDLDPFGGFATAGDPGASDLLSGRWGVAVAAQGAMLIGAWLLESAARRAPVATWGRHTWLWALGVPPAAALIAISWSSHAAGGSDAITDIAVDATHNIATGVWVGGLVGLLVFVLLPTRDLADPTRVAQVAPVVVRFSAVAVVAVTGLVVTGLYRALAELGDPGDLIDTGYGQVLAVKLGLFALLLGVGAYNRFVAHPRLEQAQLGLADSDRGASRALLRTVRIEIGLAAAVLVSVGVLVSLAPPG